MNWRTWQHVTGIILALCCVGFFLAGWLREEGVLEDGSIAIVYGIVVFAPLHLLFCIIAAIAGRLASPTQPRKRKRRRTSRSVESNPPATPAR